MFKKLFIIAALITGVALAQVSTTGNRVSYSGNGSTTAFSYPNKFFSNSDLVVIDRNDTTGAETTKTLTTHYTVTGAGVSSGGTVTMLTAPASGHSLIIYQDPSRVQDLDLDENDPLPPEQLEKRLDKLVIQNQRDKARIDRSIRLSEGHPTFDPTIPSLLAVGDALVVNDTVTGWSLANLDNIDLVSENLAGGTTGQYLAKSSGSDYDFTWSTLSVPNATLANMPTQTFKGRTTAGTGAPEDLTATQATAILNNYVGDSGAGGTKGLVPAPAAGDAAANKYLKADGTWATAGGTITGGTNLGATGSSVFSAVNGANMEFRKIKAGTNITLTQNTNDITIDATASGTGDVVGPASATDNAVARFDLTTGKLIQNSGVTISDADLLSAANVNVSGLTASRALTTDGSKNLASSSVTSTELDYVSGVTSAIQTQIDGKQATDTDLTAVAGLSTTGLIARTGAGTASTRTVTGTANQITVTNGDGVSGNPTLSIPSDPVLPGTDLTVGTSSGVTMKTGTADPTVTATSANAGSLYFNTSTANIYRKTDAGSSTNWVLLGTSAAVTEWTAYTPTFTGFGTVSTQNFMYRQVGNSVQIQGRFLTGTTTATEARISLPTGCTSASDYVTLEFAGGSVGNSTSVAGRTLHPLIEPSVGYITFGYGDNTVNQLAKANGNGVAGSATTVSVNAEVRCTSLASVQ
jgi:hypothetical protein